MASPFVYTQLVSVSLLVSSQLSREGVRSDWKNSDSDVL